MAIHATAIIDPTAEVDKSAEIGPYVIIEAESKIGAGTRIMAHAVIGKYTEIGQENEIHYGAVIGHDPQHLKFEKEWKTFLKIGDRNIIREQVSIHRGSVEAAATEVGDDNFLMGFSHIGHDCKIGNRIVLGNFTGISGHVEIHDGAVISGLSGVHQNVRVGTLSIVGGMSRVGKDVPPYMTAVHTSVTGLNVVGLRRAGFSREQRHSIKEAFKILYRSGLNVSQAIEQLETMQDIPEVKIMIDFIKASKRGICRPMLERKDV